MQAMVLDDPIGLKYLGQLKQDCDDQSFLREKIEQDCIVMPDPDDVNLDIPDRKVFHVKHNGPSLCRPVAFAPCVQCDSALSPSPSPCVQVLSSSLPSAMQQKSAFSVLSPLSVQQRSKRKRSSVLAMAIAIAMVHGHSDFRTE